FKELSGENSEVVELEFDGEVLDILQKFQLQDAPLTIQDHFIQRLYQLKKHYIEIIDWKQVGYEIWYTFQRENSTAAFKYWINKKKEFRPTFQKLPARTNSDEFYDVVFKILEQPQPILINRKTAESIISKIMFDVELEEDKPFLKNLLDSITSQLNPDEVISEIIHIEYRERYTFNRGSEECVIDFEYNKNGFFGRVLPIENKSNSLALIDRIREIVNSLTTTAYAC